MTKLADAILIEGLDDWVPLDSAYAITKRLHPLTPETDARELVVATVRDLLDTGMAELGILTRDDGFCTQHGSTSELTRMVADAFAEGGRDRWGYALWLNNTAAGDARARTAEEG
jgi:hypothetical protein